MFIFNPASQLILLYRFYSKLYNYKFLWPLSYFLYFVTRIIYSSDIHPRAKIGLDFSIRHHFGIVIGKNVTIGDNCIIYNSVSIGQFNINDERMPTLKNNIVLYKGAVVIGYGTMLDGTIVGANKVVVLK